MARVRSLNASPPRLAGIGPVHQSRHVKRAQAASRIEIRDGSFNLPLSQLQHAPVVVGLAITWPKTDRFVEVANCVRPVAEGDIGRSAVVVGFAVIAAKCNRPIKIQYRFVLLAFCRKGITQIVQYQWIIGTKSFRVFKVGNGAVMFSQLAPDDAAIDIRVGEIRDERNGCVQVSQSSFANAETLKQTPRL